MKDACDLFGDQVWAQNLTLPSLGWVGRSGSRRIGLGGGICGVWSGI